MADIVALFGESPVTVRARVIETDGEVAGIAGYYLSGGVAVFFSEIRKPIPKMTIWRESLRFMKDVKMPAVCFSEDGSGAFLKRLGWTECDGEFQWRP